MATSNYGKDDSTYLQLKALIHAKRIKTIGNKQYLLLLLLINTVQNLYI